MITAKALTKYLRIAALVAAAVLLLAGCSDGSSEELPFVPLGDETDTVSEYRVIISREVSGEVIELAHVLCERIEEKTGVHTILAYDDETLLYRENAHEVIIGMTSRTVSRTLLRGMRRDDYICAAEGGHTVIGGRSDSACITAINRFCDEILPVSTSGRLIPEGGGFSFKGSYPIEKLMLSGVELSGYTVEVTRSSDADAVSAAYLLQRQISQATGYILDIAFGDAAGRRISLSTRSSEKNETAYIESDEMGLVITADRGKGLEYAVEYLVDLLQGGEEITLPDMVSVPYGDASIKIGSARLDSLVPFGSIGGVNAAVEILEGGNPEITFCGVMSVADRTKLEDALPDTSALEGSKTAVLLADGQSASVTLVGSSHADGDYTVERFKLETPRLKILLFYICGTSKTNKTVTLSAEDGYIPVALVHTEGGAGVTLKNSDGQILSPTVSLGSLVCYSDASLVDVSAAVNDKFSPMYGEIEIFAR